MVFHIEVWYIVEEEDLEDLVSVDIIHLRETEDLRDFSNQEGFSVNIFFLPFLHILVVEV